MKIKKTLIAAILTVLVSTAAQGQLELNGTYYTSYGLNFVTGRQSLLVGVQNPRYSDSEIVPCVRVRAVIDLFEAAGDGSVRPRPLRRVIREIELDPGEAASFDVPAILVCDGSVCPAAHYGVFASVTVFGTPIEQMATSRLKFSSTLAVRESERTVFVLPATEKGFDPQPDPPQE